MSETSLEQLKHAHTDKPVHETIQRRWSPRAWADKPVSKADLETIFTAGTWAASSYNEQPWRFVVGIKGDAVWEKVLGALMPANQSWAKAAPVLYASFAKKTFSHNGAPNLAAPHDVGAASATISLQATAMGLHTHGMGGYDRDALRTAFAVPDDYEPVACWALGYLGDPATLPENFQGMETQPRTRKGLDVVIFGEWETPAF